MVEERKEGKRWRRQKRKRRKSDIFNSPYKGRKKRKQQDDDGTDGKTIQRPTQEKKLSFSASKRKRGLAPTDDDDGTTIDISSFKSWELSKKKL